MHAHSMSVFGRSRGRSSALVAFGSSTVKSAKEGRHVHTPKKVEVKTTLPNVANNATAMTQNGGAGRSLGDEHDASGAIGGSPSPIVPAVSGRMAFMAPMNLLPKPFSLSEMLPRLLLPLPLAPFPPTAPATPAPVGDDSGCRYTKETGITHLVH